MGTSRALPSGEIVCGYRLVRELESRGAPTYVALHATRAAAAGTVALALFPDGSEALAKDVRALLTLHHPNLVRVRDVVAEKGRVAVASDLVDAEPLAPLLAAGLPLGGLLLVLTDILEGLTAVHALRATKDPARVRVHGQVVPRNIFVGRDGVTRLAFAFRPVVPAPADVIGYLAPELVLNDESTDAGTDVYGVGVLLWEGLTGRRLHTTTDAGQIVLRLLGGKIERATAPKDAPWAEPLADVARRAIAPEPTSRFPSAAAMSAEVRAIAGEHRWQRSALAAWLEARGGGKSADDPAARASIPTPIVPFAPVLAALSQRAATEAERITAPPLPPKAARPPAPPPAPPPPSIPEIPEILRPAGRETAGAPVPRAWQPPPRPASTPEIAEVLAAPPPPQPSPPPPPIPPPPPPSAESTDAPLAVAAPSDPVEPLPRRRVAPRAALAVALLLVLFSFVTRYALAPASAPRAAAPVAAARPGPVSAEPMGIAVAPPGHPSVGSEAPAESPADDTVPADTPAVRAPIDTKGESAGVLPARPPIAAPPAGSLSAEPVAPSPLRKKPKTTYYPLGI